MNIRAPITAGAAAVLMALLNGGAAFAQDSKVPQAVTPAAGERPDQADAPKNETSPAKPETGHAQEAAPAKLDGAAAKEASRAMPAVPPTRLVCRAVRNDIGMYEPLRFMSITIDIPKKYVKMVQEGDGRVFEYMDGGPGNAHRNFVKITDDSVEYGRQGKETWRIDRYTGTMTSSTFTIQFECQPRPTERKF